MIEDGWWNLSWQDDSWLVGWLQNWSRIMMTMTRSFTSISTYYKNMSPFLVNLFAEIWEKGWGVKGAETSLPVKSRKFVDQLIDLIEKIVGHREESLQGNSDHKNGQGHDSAESKLDVPDELSLRSFFSRAEDIPNFCRIFFAPQWTQVEGPWYVHPNSCRLWWHVHWWGDTVSCWSSKCCAVEPCKWNQKMKIEERFVT